MNHFKVKSTVYRYLIVTLITACILPCFRISAGFASNPHSQYPHAKAMEQKVLFNGRDMQGWTLVDGGKWYVSDGELVGEFDTKNTNRGWLVTNEVFGNFDFKLKYKITKAGYSGICFRVPPGEARDAESSGYEVEIRSEKDEIYGSGSIYNIQRAYEKIEKDNEWNDLTIKAVGDRITVILNDSTVVDINNRRSLSGVFALQTPDKNSVIRFKDIKVLPLPNTVIMEDPLEDMMNRAPGKWIKLFNGYDLKGWHIIWGNKSIPEKDITKEPNFVVEDGKIVGKNSAAPGWIISTREFKNFIFKVKWRMPLGGNSGITIRYPFPSRFSESLRNPAYFGYEIQVISRNPVMSMEDFINEKKQNSYYKNNGLNHNLCGSIYDVASAHPYLEKAGEWNEYIIYAYKDHIITYVNGIKAAEAHPVGRSLEGSVGMQVHGGGDAAEYFEYKDIFIKEIDVLE